MFAVKVTDVGVLTVINVGVALTAPMVGVLAVASGTPATCVGI
jgi:hypothetical protein